MISVLRWVLTERRFAPLLQPLTGEESEPIHFLAWFELPRHERLGRTPFAYETSGPEKLRLAVSAALAGMVEERLRTWSTLQELAGVVTPFTDRVREQVEAQLEGDHQQRVASLEARHRAELGSLKDDLGHEMAQRVRQGLEALAGYGPPGEQGAGAPGHIG